MTNPGGAILKTLIQRPVAVLLGHVCLALFGIMGLMNLPFNRMPDVEYPTLLVGASLPGATPEQMSSSVAAPLEERVCGVVGLLDCTTSCVQGFASITLRFRPGEDMGRAMGEVGRALRAASADLPGEMTEAPTCRRYNPTDTPLIYLALESPNTPESELEELAHRLATTRLGNLPGVARVQVLGSGQFAWVVRNDPKELARRGISSGTVMATVADQGNERPWGRLEGPLANIQLEGTGPVAGEALHADQIALPRHNAPGPLNKPPVWLSDVASVSAEPTGFRVGHWRNGRPCLIIALYREAGANALALSAEARKVMEEIQTTLPPGAELFLVNDNSKPIRDALNEMIITLFLSLLTILGIIGLGLRDWRGTMIACSVVPLSLAGITGFMWLAGFSLNTLTLLALTLAISFVVDDAVVVLENIIRHREMGKDRIRASVEGASEVAFTMSSITVSLLAIFLPVLLVPDILGRMFREFALTLMGCITLSGIVSMLLVPVLCLWMPSRTPDKGMDKHREPDKKHGIYQRFLGWLVDHPLIGLAGMVLFLVGTASISGKVRKGFLPEEDKSFLLLFTQSEPQVSWDRLRSSHQEIWRTLAGVPEIEQHLTFLGSGDINTNANEGTILLRLKYPPRRSLGEITRDLRARLDAQCPLKCRILNIPSLYLNTKKTKSAYQVQVTASENRRLGKIVDNIRSWMENEGRFLDIDSDLDPGVPTLEMIPDRARMALAGFTATDGAAALYASFGPTFASKLWVRDATRSVYVGLTEKALEYPSTMDLLRLQRNNGEILGGSAPLSEFVQNSPVLRPSQANRYNRLAAASISFNLLPGVDAAATLRALETQLTEVSGDGVQAALVGTAKEVISSLARALPLVLLSFLVMYLTLGFLYESLGHPLTVLATLPSALLGGLAGLWIFDLELDIYGFFGLLMLLGIVKKNAIMLVDFARQRQREGVGARQAILEASMERLRPIQLTTLAAAAGALPMLVGTGSGISVLKPVGAILLGGLLVSQVVTLALTPPLYRLVEGASARARWFFDWGAK